MSTLDPTATPLVLRLFGPFEVFVDGTPLPHLRTQKGRWLLALLALRAGSPVARDWLAGTLWPDSPQSQSLAGLRRSLTDLRQALGPAADRLGSPTPPTLCLDLSDAAVDVLAFDACLARDDPASLEAAVALYRGPLLQECTEAWALQERERREQAHLGALETLATHALAAGDPGTAERHLRRAVGVDPLRESAQRALMQAQAQGRNHAAAIQTYRELRLLLHRELNAEPDPETVALFQQIRAAAREKAVLGARCSALGEGSGQPSRARAAGVPAEHRAPSTERGSEATLTFLFTDIEGSTRLWEAHPEAMRDALIRHDALLRDAIETSGGVVFKTFGDQFCAAFATPPDALAAARVAQRALHSEPWGAVGALRVRMALHTGTAEERDGDYFGPPLNRVARLLAAAHGGQILLSLATVELVRDPLPEGASLRDLGERRLQDLSRPERIFQLVTPDLPADFPPLRTLEAFPHNLPLQLTSFIGREEAIAQVKGLLAEQRLVTLTGAGGCGKTRLALHMAGDLLQEQPDGVWLVDLAPLSEPALVPQTVAAALGVREESGTPLTQALVSALKPRRMLLVLDNCEHLLAACATVADALLRGCPGVRLLATSREGLNIPGEAPYRVRSLTCPDPQQPSATLESLSEYEAVQLFVDRATTATASFRLIQQNAPAVAEICARLDGIPLAIELAAPLVRVLPVEQLATRLDDRFRLLTGGSRTALPRQQTLRALIDWSYDLLSDQEQRLLRRLSVFAGGWTLEAAERVCAGERIEAWEVLDPLTGLVDKSLVVVDEQGAEARYRLLETVRHYSQERLLESGEEARVRGYHGEFFLRLAEEAEEQLHGPKQVEWLNRLEREHDNLRATLEWSKTGAGDPEVGLRLAGALWWFWEVHGHYQEGRESLAALLSLVGPTERTVARAKALLAAGELEFRQGSLERAITLMEESLALSRELGDQRGIAYSLYFLGVVASKRDLERGIALCEESLALFRELGDLRGCVWSLNTLGWLASEQRNSERMAMLGQESLAVSRELGSKGEIALSLDLLGSATLLQEELEGAAALFELSLALSRELGDNSGVDRSLYRLVCVAEAQGDYERMATLSEERLALNRELGDRIGVLLSLRSLGGGGPGLGHALRALGLVALHRGEYERATRLFEERLALNRELGMECAVADTLTKLGHLAQRQGDPDRARVLLRESLASSQKLQRPWLIVDALEELAVVADVLGRPARAALLLGAAQALRDPNGTASSWLEPGRQPRAPDYDRMVPDARTVLGEAAFAVAWAEGRALSLEEAIAEALEEP